jgi:plastocyanin
MNSFPMECRQVRRVLQRGRLTEKNMRMAILLAPLALMACGSSSSAAAAITLRPAGADPTSVTVTGGAQVQFANADSIDHRLASGDCPELTSSTISAGASFTATMGNGPKTCTFDDALQPSAAAFQGTVIVQSSMGANDAGYYGNPYGP